MPAAGDPVYASDVLRARPTILDDSASSSLAASSTDTDIPGISISFTTETAGATVSATWFIQIQNSGAVPTASGNARARMTGPSAFVQASGVYAIWRSSGAATDQATPGNQFTFTCAAAGTYTVTLRGTTAASEVINVYSSLRCIVQEQWS